MFTQPFARTLSPLLFFCALSVGCATPTQQLSLSGAPMLGHSGARTELIVFSDFQCSFCKKAAREIQRLMRAHPNRFKVYYKHFPLTYHPYSQQAAQAAEAARRQGKFWQMHDQLFAHAEELSDATVVMLAKEIGLDVDRFEADMNSPAVIARVAADRAEGERLGVNGTPYFIINRTPFHGSFEDLKRKI
ncbi:MAG: thioredoxin domain-containing protein [Deltaproteobacteria bacterium]|nr:thioredoxin domain-containing protein [Deltaproteobacteria bacterium]